MHLNRRCNHVLHVLFIIAFAQLTNFKFILGSSLVLKSYILTVSFAAFNDSFIELNFMHLHYRYRRMHLWFLRGLWFVFMFDWWFYKVCWVTPFFNPNFAHFNPNWIWYNGIPFSIFPRLYCYLWINWAFKKIVPTFHHFLYFRALKLIYYMCVERRNHFTMLHRFVRLFPTIEFLAFWCFTFCSSILQHCVGIVFIHDFAAISFWIFAYDIIEFNASEFERKHD